MIAYSDAVTITVAFAAFFLILVLLTFARLLLRKAPPPDGCFRIGLFIERNRWGGDESVEPDEEPTAAITASYPRAGSADG